MDGYQLLQSQGVRVHQMGPIAPQHSCFIRHAIVPHSLVPDVKVS